MTTICQNSSHKIYDNTHHISLNTPNLSQKVKTFLWVYMERKYVQTPLLKQFFLISPDSALRVKISLIVKIVLHATQTELFFFSFLFFKIKECVK